MEILALVVVLLFASFFILSRVIKNKRQQFIAEYVFPKKVSEKVLEVYPHLKSKDVELVLKVLQDYFLMCNMAKMKSVSMPSQVVDIAWHEFILFTRNYNLFCKKSFGKFLHHTPAEAMKTQTTAQEGIIRAWKHACVLESIDPASPYKLPLIFAIDSQLKIPDGFKYVLNCYPGGDGYCAGHIGCTASPGCAGSADSGCNGGGGCSGGGD